MKHLPGRLREALEEAKRQLPDIEHVKDFDIRVLDRARIRESENIFFNMAAWHAKYSCGTVCCIGGLCEHILGARLTQEEFAAASDLFYPTDISVMFGMTPQQAVKAIDNFLETGDPKWETI